MKPTRRSILATTAGVAAATRAQGAKIPTSSVYEHLGVKPVINGMGTVTILGGSLMPPEVIRAMDEAAQHFIHLPELQDKASIKLASMLNVPGAMVTGGAAASITVGTAACLARGDKKTLRKLPNTSDIPNEIIQQKTHHSGYEHQMTLAGAKVITVETADELERAITPKTAMLFYMNKAEKLGKIQREEFLRIAKKHGVPTFLDAAADVPPKENLWNYVNKDGFDLVAFSGGKGMMGPQSAGLLLGRKDLIDTAREAQSPYDGIGRGMKVGKEEIVGMIAAVERYLKTDHEAEARELDKRVSEMMKTLSDIKGLQLSKEIPEIANNVPHLMIQWDEGALNLKARDLHKKLIEGDPSIYTLLQGRGKLMVSVWMMRGTEHRTVAKRIVEIAKPA